MSDNHRPLSNKNDISSEEFIKSANIEAETPITAGTQKSILQTINDHNAATPDLSNNFHLLKLGTWWIHTPSNTHYQLRRLPQSMDKLNDKKSAIVLWNRDNRIAIHLPVEIPSDFKYLGSGHNPP